MDRAFRLLLAFVRAVKDREALEPRDTEELERGLKELSHAKATKNMKGVGQAIDRIARVFTSLNEPFK